MTEGLSTPGGFAERVHADRPGRHPSGGFAVFSAHPYAANDNPGVMHIFYNRGDGLTVIRKERLKEKRCPERSRREGSWRLLVYNVPGGLCCVVLMH